MALQFPCPHCQRPVTLRFLKISERYMCKSCGASDIVPESAVYIEDSELPAPSPAPDARPAQQPTPPAYPTQTLTNPATGESFQLPDYIITDYSRHKREALQSSTAPRLPFMRAFWTITGWIAFYQLFAVLLEIYHNTNSALDDTLYFVVAGGFGMGWTILMTLYVIVDIQSHELKPGALFNLSLATLKEYTPQLLKYFAIAGAVVLLFSFISGGSELELARMSRTGIILAFIGTVIVAPICEEMVFRGYLYTALRSQFHKPSERIAINAMLFAGAHVFLVMFFIGAAVPYYIFALGYFLAKLYEDSNSITPCIALHMLNNSLVFLIEWLVYQGYWSTFQG